MSKISKQEKKKARMKLLLLMDSDPKWDRKPEKRKLRNQLVSIIDDSFVPNEKNQILTCWLLRVFVMTTIEFAG